MSQPRKQSQADKIAYHKEQMHIYRAIDKITHNTHFTPVVRDGEACVIPIDEEGNEIREDY